MKKLLLILLLAGFSISSAFAQNIEEKSTEDLIKIAEQNGFKGQLNQDLRNLRDMPGQAAVIKQIGDNNNAKVTLSGVNLFTYILQDGSHLNANLLLEGRDNNAVIKQFGSYLTSDIILQGRNNDFKMLQNGQGLSNDIKLLNANNMDIIFMQTEQQFLYSQNGKGGIPLTIETNQTVPTITVTNN